MLDQQQAEIGATGPLSTPLRRRQRRAMVLVIAALGVIGAACSTSNTPTSYGPLTHDNFVHACNSAGESSTFCEQTYTAMAAPDGLPFDQFETIDSELRKNPTEVPVDLQSFLDANAPTTSTGGSSTN